MCHNQRLWLVSDLAYLVGETKKLRISMSTKESIRSICLCDICNTFFIYTSKWKVCLFIVVYRHWRHFTLIFVTSSLPVNGYDLKGPRFLWSHPKDPVAERLAVELSQSVDFNDVGLSRLFYVYFFFINVYCINVQYRSSWWFQIVN